MIAFITRESIDALEKIGGDITIHNCDLDKSLIEELLNEGWKKEQSENYDRKGRPTASWITKEERQGNWSLVITLFLWAKP